MSTRVPDRFRSSRILQGSAWIMVGLAMQSGLGLAFWWLGARVASADELGRSAALFSAIQFVNYASGMGLTVALARHATDTSRDSDALFSWGVVATVVSSAAFGAGFLVVASGGAIDLVDGWVGGWVIFCAYTAGTSVGLLVEVRLMSERRWAWLMGKLAVVGLVRLPLVLVDMGDRADVWMYHLMLAPSAIAGVLSVPLLHRMGAGRFRFGRPPAVASFVRYTGANWVATLASQAPQFVLPLLVFQSVSSSDNANFFLAWTFTGVVLLLPAAISQILLLEGSKDVAAASGEHHEPEPGRVREALLFSLGIAVVAWLGALVVGPLLSWTFGDDFDEMAHTLSLLTAAGIPWAFTAVRLSEARIRRDQLATVLITVVLGAGILVPALFWVPADGVDGASRAWILGNVLAAVVAVGMHQRRRRAQGILGRRISVRPAA
jgi:O-antigen/teichoic acid export membrane protein